MKRIYISLLGVILAAGCGDAVGDGAYEDSFVDEDPPMGGCESGGTGPCGEGSADGQSAVGEPCDGTNQCDSGLTCAAPFTNGDPGRLVCQSSCIALDDPTMWCSDDAACCTGECGPRGLCTTPEGPATGVDDTDGGDEGASESGSGSGTSDSGSDDGEGSGSSTSG